MDVIKLLRTGVTHIRARAQGGLDALERRAEVDPNRIAAIGFCLGGTMALELARSGANLAGVVSFYGSLSTAAPQDAKNIKGKVLVCVGADDPEVPPALAGWQDSSLSWIFVIGTAPPDRLLPNSYISGSYIPRAGGSRRPQWRIALRRRAHADDGILEQTGIQKIQLIEVEAIQAQISRRDRTEAAHVRCAIEADRLGANGVTERVARRGDRVLVRPLRQTGPGRQRRDQQTGSPYQPVTSGLDAHGVLPLD
jgi:hypothetical protein